MNLAKELSNWSDDQLATAIQELQNKDNGIHVFGDSKSLVRQLCNRIQTELHVNASATIVATQCILTEAANRFLEATRTAQLRDLVFRALDNAKHNESDVCTKHPQYVAEDLALYDADIESFPGLTLAKLFPHILEWQELNNKA